MTRLHHTTAAGYRRTLAHPVDDRCAAGIPDLIPTEQPLSHSGHAATVIGDWFIGVFSVLTATVAQRFLASREEPQAEAEEARISEGEQAIMARLDELVMCLRWVESGVPAGNDGRGRATS